MPNYAVIENNIIKNIIVADSKELAEQITSSVCFEINGDEKIGWIYNNGTATPLPKEDFIIIDKVAEPPLSS